MTIGYGSDNPDTADVVHPPSTSSSASPSFSSRTKRVVVVACTTFLATGLLVGFQWVHASPRQSVVPVALDAAMTPSDSLTTLALGRPFMIRMPNKGWCVDDGGGWSNGATKFVLSPCDRNNVNQVFTYDVATGQLKNVAKQLCVDDGGGYSNGETKFHLWDCSATNANQQFVYDAVAQSFRSRVKPALCMDDGGGAMGVSQFHLWDCTTANINQQFDLLPIATITDTIPVPVVDPLMTNITKFILRSIMKPNFCVDDGGGMVAGQTQFHLWDCHMANMNQVFQYDPATFLVQSVAKPGLCMDDGGGQSNGATQFRLWPCDATSPDQTFLYDRTTHLVRSASKPGLCMDDGGGYSNGQTKFHLWDCMSTNGNQLFQLEPWGGVSSTGEDPPVDGPMEPPVTLPTSEAPFLPQQVDEPTTYYPGGESMVAGDWNLLAPSRETINAVNADGSMDITSDEIYSYLLGIKDREDQHHAKMLYKFHRTYQCVTDGLTSFATTSVSATAYHTLVAWMDQHCIHTERGDAAPTTTDDRVFMTKLEFYQQIKDHFATTHEQLDGAAASARLRSSVAQVDREKLASCMEQARLRFDGDVSPMRLHKAIQWVETACMRHEAP